MLFKDNREAAIKKKEQLRKAREFRERAILKNGFEFLYQFKIAGDKLGQLLQEYQREKFMNLKYVMLQELRKYSEIKIDKRIKMGLALRHDDLRLQKSAFIPLTRLLSRKV